MDQFRSIQVPVEFGYIKNDSVNNPMQSWVCIDKNDEPLERFDTYYKAHLYLFTRYGLIMKGLATHQKDIDSYIKKQIDNILTSI